MLIGYGVGLEASFTGNAKKEMKETVQKLHSEKDSGLNILGFKVRGPTNPESQSSTGKDAMAFDEESGKLSISPEKNLYVSLVLTKQKFYKLTLKTVFRFSLVS